MSPLRKRAKRIQHNFIARIRLPLNTSNQNDTHKWDIVSIQNLSATGILFNYNVKMPLKTIGRKLRERFSKYMWTDEELNKFFLSEKGKEYADIITTAYITNEDYESVQKKLKELEKK